jgi:hypothetical protein
MFYLADRNRSALPPRRLARDRYQQYEHKSSKQSNQLQIVNVSKKIFISVVLCATAVMITLAVMDRCKREKDLDTNGYISLGKVIRRESNRSFNDCYFEYYVDGKKYVHYENEKGFNDSYLNKYYLIKVSSVNPQNSIIYLDEEITDSTKIAASGF